MGSLDSIELEKQGSLDNIGNLRTEGSFVIQSIMRSVDRKDLWIRRV